MDIHILELARLENYSVISVTHNDCVKAMSLSIKDFEDAPVVICAIKANANYIVTRDEKFLQADSPIAIITPNKMVGLSR
jgi:predicted nucleic acid-binding protein